MVSYTIHDIDDKDWYAFKSKLTMNNKIQDVFLKFIKTYGEVKENDMD